MRRPILALAALAVLVAAAPPQKRRDRVIPKKGAPVEGKVSKDSWKGVTIGSRSFKAEEIERIEYGDAPAAFRGAMGAIERGKWDDALTTLNSAEEYANSKEKGVVKPGAWFPSYLAYYRGLCLLELGRLTQALLQFNKIRKQFAESRFLPEAYELALQACREKGDEKAMAALEKEIDAAPSAIRGSLKNQATLERAFLLLGKKKYDAAKKLFERGATSPDPTVAAQNIFGVIKCLSALKDTKGIKQICDQVLNTRREPALLLVASNALGDDFYTKDKFNEAATYYRNSVVLHHPGKANSEISREHERAIYRLARCYEELMKAASKGDVKKILRAMASSTYRELSIEYPFGRHSEEAATKAIRYGSESK